MRTFVCNCGNPLHFENSVCLACGHDIGFMPATMSMGRLATPGWRKCANYAEHQVCNWLVDDGHAFCVACRLNRVIPDLSSSWNRLLWQRIERAKRRLVYDLMNLGLPFDDLEFAFLEDLPEGTEFTEDGTDGRVMTGHLNGRITINIAEADDVAREQMRVAMNEAYRTLLGHFRHESGHHYWNLLVLTDAARLASFRALFGDERQDYASVLDRYYAEGPPADWSVHHISAYASSHPWEDWAETWAHYLQMSDALETAQEAPAFTGVAPARNFDEMIAAWMPLTTSINSMNRSLGLADAYPFALAEATTEKLRFVHHVISGAAQSAKMAV